MPYFRGLSDEVSCVAIQQREDLTPQTTLKHKVSSPPPSSAPAAVGSDTPSARNVRLPTHPCSPCPPPTGFCPSNRSTWVRRGCHRRQVAVEFGPPPPGALVCKKIERFSFADARINSLSSSSVLVGLLLVGWCVGVPGPPFHRDPSLRS